MTTFFDKWLLLLNDKSAVSVATLFNGTGSRPRANGSQMLISESEMVVDTIGGGKLEADVILCAKQVIENKTSMLHHFEMTNEDIALSDMICGGKGDVLIYFSDERDICVLNLIKELKVRDGWLLFPIETNSGISFVSAEGTFIGDILVCKNFLNTEKTSDVYIIKIDGIRYLAQWITETGKLHIMGAGHISQKIVDIANLVDIECFVYDDRAEFINDKRFPDAQLVLIDNLSKPPNIELTSKDMIVIVTRGHMFDKDDLAWALNTDAGYIGMIGSKKKVNMIFKSMIQKGYSIDNLNRVFAPIGLDIGAETPSEIAVAIVAQLIAFKRRSDIISYFPANNFPFEENHQDNQRPLISRDHLHERYDNHSCL